MTSRTIRTGSAGARLCPVPGPGRHRHPHVHLGTHQDARLGRRSRCATRPTCLSEPMATGSSGGTWSWHSRSSPSSFITRRHRMRLGICGWFGSVSGRNTVAESRSRDRRDRSARRSGPGNRPVRAWSRTSLACGDGPAAATRSARVARERAWLALRASKVASQRGAHEDAILLAAEAARGAHWFFADARAFEAEARALRIRCLGHWDVGRRAAGMALPPRRLARLEVGAHDSRWEEIRAIFPADTSPTREEVGGDAEREIGACLARAEALRQTLARATPCISAQSCGPPACW